jgi:hypothetical protein
VSAKKRGAWWIKTSAKPKLDDTKKENYRKNYSEYIALQLTTNYLSQAFGGGK